MSVLPDKEKASCLSFQTKTMLINQIRRYYCKQFKEDHNHKFQFDKHESKTVVVEYKDTADVTTYEKECKTTYEEECSKTHEKECSTS